MVYIVHNKDDLDQQLTLAEDKLVNAAGRDSANDNENEKENDNTNDNYNDNDDDQDVIFCEVSAHDEDAVMEH
ncbi:GD24594 [Drosophila simulans]|uniref:GD24594 n=1 Tax=Drosophila simulans TaxID=7240 RepID=B4NU21_DROSI|nr:GD24594 [Drosophila simulans]